MRAQGALPLPRCCLRGIASGDTREGRCAVRLRHPPEWQQGAPASGFRQQRVLRYMTARGLEEPLVVVSDKHKGLRKAVREVLPHALKQPCLAHKMRNILSKLLRKAEKDMNPLVHQVFYASSYEEGLRLGQGAYRPFQESVPLSHGMPRRRSGECLTYLKFPEAHWRVIRTSNLLERTFGEGRRRTKVIPRFPTESSALRLLYATLITASQSWRAIRMPPDIWWELEVLGREAFGEQSQKIGKELVAV